MGEVYYVTTPIYYVNDEPHIGTAYTTVAADTLARYHRLLGKEVFFLTGTDEHGQKVAQAAAEKGVDPQSWADKMVKEFLKAWKILDISYDDFIRTTENRHTQVAQLFIKKLHDNGDVYLGTYEGWYCIPDESFLLSSQLADGNCPTCGRPVEWVKEQNYFFRLSRYADRVLKHIEENPEFVQPEVRRNEVMSFIKGGVSDQSISRTSLTWGIPLPFDEQHVMYVWFDALLNYVSSIGYGTDEVRFENIWPANLHLIGKEILKFHAVIWPAMLMAAGLPLPRHVFAHGWLTVEGEKMSKSLGNAIRPEELVEEFGVDAYRYYFLREFSFGLDGNFSRRTFKERFNAQLANDLGNMVARILTMAEKYSEGLVPDPKGYPPPAELKESSAELVRELSETMERLSFSEALVAIWKFIHVLNRYVDITAPWSLAKESGKEEELMGVLYSSLEGLRLTALFISPFMPRAAGRIWERLGIAEPLLEQTLPQAANWGGLTPGLKVQKGEPLFPRLT